MVGSTPLDQSQEGNPHSQCISAQLSQWLWLAQLSDTKEENAITLQRHQWSIGPNDEKIQLLSQSEYGWEKEWI